LADRIRAYWHGRKENPEVWVEPHLVQASDTDHRLHWQVRSDMVGGWPLAASLTANPSPQVKIDSGLMADSARASKAMSGMWQRRTGIESHGPSNRVCREPERMGFWQLAVAAAPTVNNKEFTTPSERNHQLAPGK
jgi:hypothetical protein